MLPVDLVIDDEDYFDDLEDEEVSYYEPSHHGSLSSQQHIGCQLYSSHISPKPMRKACGRVRGLGRNRQVNF